MFPLILLLRLRWTVAARTLARSPSVLGGILLVLLVAAPASLAAGHRTAEQLALLPPVRVAAFLTRLFLILQALWLLLLLLPEGTLTLSRGVPAPVLRPFPIPARRLTLAATLGGLLDLPVLFIVPVLAAIVGYVSKAGALACLCAVAAVALLLIQTSALGQVLEHAATLLSRQRRASIRLILGGALLLGACLGLPPAFAATTQITGQDAGRAAGPLSGGWSLLIPAGMAGRGMTAVAQRSWGAAAGCLALLAGSALVTMGCAGYFLEAAMRRDGGGGASRRRSPLPRKPAGSAAVRGRPLAAPPEALRQTLAICRTEWVHLTRDPGAHLPLRSPALLLLSVFLGLILADNSADALVNLRDLLGIGAILFVLLWQVQLLCNRFGSEAGTARLLFGFPVPRRRLLAGKNAALGAVLMCVDGALLTGGCLSAHAPERIALLLGWLAPTLVTATAFGNVVSALAPFPIREPGERLRREPERGLAFVYVLMALFAAGALWPVHRCLEWAQGAGMAVVMAAVLAAGIYLMLIYGAALGLAATLLTRREQRLMGRLDGKG